MILPKEATQHFKRQCEYKRLEVMCGLLKEGDRVLDIGCGIGTYTSNPLAHLPVNITAIDYDSKSVEYAKKRNTRKNLEFIVASAGYFESEEKFDVIVCSHILEHTNTPMLLLSNMRRLLKENGVFYLGVPNGFGWFEAQNLAPRMLCRMEWGRRLVRRMMGNNAKDTLNTDSPHVRFFTVGYMEWLLGIAGWKVIKQINDEFLGGIVFDRVFSMLPALGKWNADVADRIPVWLANGWVFICKKGEV